MQDGDTAKTRVAEQRFRALFEAAEQLGINGPFTNEELGKKFESLERGLPTEDEFAVLVTWLGRCRLIHKLEQIQYPESSRESYQVPDFLAIFEHEDKLIPVLIEVKKTKDAVIKWSAKYYTKLRYYADSLNLPLLIAWKYRPDDGINSSS